MPGGSELEDVLAGLDVAGIEILAAEGYKKDAQDFRGQLSRVREKHSQTVFLLGFPWQSPCSFRPARRPRETNRGRSAMPERSGRERLQPD